MTHQGTDGTSLYEAKRPSLAYDPVRGRVVVCWDGNLDDDNHAEEEIEVYCGEWDRSLTPTIAPVQVSQAGPPVDSEYAALRSTTAWLGNGWVTCWDEDGANQNAFEIVCETLSEDLQPSGHNPLTISSMGTDPADADRDAFSPIVSRNVHTGDLLVVWQGDGDDAGLADDEWEIFGQRLTTADLVFADGFESGDLGAW